MAPLRPRADHQQAASRRLELLTAELAAARPDPAPDDDPWLDGHTRIRPLRAVPDPVPEPHPPRPPSPPLVPVPGRHAARRPGGPPALVPVPLRGRISLGPTQLLVVAVLVAVGIAVTGWWVVRGDPERLEAPAPATTGGAAAPTAAAGSPPSSAVPSQSSAPAGAAGAPEVTVDVTGKVRRPGIVVLDAGARVVDAVEAAGGSRRGVDLSSLNLARVLVDGEQVVVGAPARADPGVPAGSAAPTAGALVNLNTATQAELESLPEVGPVTAQAILAWRSEHGGFTAVDELLEVDGIGDATLGQIAPHVTV
ncbi:helix-hairpin-helix domain-containing protein [Nocardioides sp. LMS-CY]|uniref:helix-hairpin-helix domain-containing protein n=1 Tax=Nocardioides sp. (strain LMS-CY) TaxID=2840457 RepID=UPI001C001760|nr:helix-hairpin-helix domain-containing protein [Nocardioides sp. LMS-CY]QWF20724.1 helix-hairpin-helix domain-containing protein [Nocardioides sp. LMS-CY]